MKIKLLTTITFLLISINIHSLDLGFKYSYSNLLNYKDEINDIKINNNSYTLTLSDSLNDFNYNFYFQGNNSNVTYINKTKFNFVFTNGVSISGDSIPNSYGLSIDYKDSYLNLEYNNKLSVESGIHLLKDEIFSIDFNFYNKEISHYSITLNKNYRVPFYINSIAFKPTFNLNIGDFSYGITLGADLISLDTKDEELAYDLNLSNIYNLKHSLSWKNGFWNIEASYSPILFEIGNEDLKSYIRYNGTSFIFSSTPNFVIESYSLLIEMGKHYKLSCKYNSLLIADGELILSSQPITNSAIINKYFYKYDNIHGNFININGEIDFGWLNINIGYLNVNINEFKYSHYKVETFLFSSKISEIENDTFNFSQDFINLSLDIRVLNNDFLTIKTGLSQIIPISFGNVKIESKPTSELFGGFKFYSNVIFTL